MNDGAPSNHQELVRAWLKECNHCDFVTYSQRHPKGRVTLRRRAPWQARGSVVSANPKLTIEIIANHDYTAKIRQLQKKASETTRSNGNAPFGCCRSWRIWCRTTRLEVRRVGIRQAGGVTPKRHYTPSSRSDSETPYAWASRAKVLSLGSSTPRSIF